MESLPNTLLKFVNGHHRNKFNKKYLLGWVNKATYFFFNFHNSPPHQWIFMVSFHMERKVIAWFQKMKKTGALTS